MASLSDQSKSEEKPASAAPAGLWDESFSFPLTEGFPDCVLRDFRSADEELLFGLNDLPCPDDYAYTDAVFLDTETTGLYGAAVQAFLVGVGYFSGRDFIVRQFLMRDLASEEALLTALNDFLSDYKVLITFNGKSFDAPLLETRLLYHRMRPQIPETHIDLIHPARRVYKLRIESCRLSNIESAVFHQGREDDLDGSLVPGRYFRYIRTGDESLLTDILEHNRQDILTMPLLAAMLCRAVEAPENNDSSTDRFSIGRYYERQKNTERAIEFYSGVEDGLWSLPAKWQRSQILKKTDPEAARTLWEEIIDETPDYCPALIELSKYHEHKTGDIPLALSYCTRAMATGMGKTKCAADLAKRFARLSKKAGKE